MPRQAHQRSHHRSGWRRSPPWRFFYPARGHQGFRSGHRLYRRRGWLGRLDFQFHQELGMGDLSFDQGASEHRLSARSWARIQERLMRPTVLIPPVAGLGRWALDATERLLR